MILQELCFILYPPFTWLWSLTPYQSPLVVLCRNISDTSKIVEALSDCQILVISFQTHTINILLYCCKALSGLKTGSVIMEQKVYHACVTTKPTEKIHNDNLVVLRLGLSVRLVAI